MTPDLDKKLLALSLAFSGAKEPAAATEAFITYLRERFQPASMKQEEGEAGPLFYGNGNALRFCLPVSPPQNFILSGAQEKPALAELATMEAIITHYRERQEAVAELKGLTHTDDLTGLFNQRYLELILDREISLAKRNGTQFSVLFLDLDHFKLVNDSHGHLIGSRLLFEVGQEIKKSLRDSDITFRYGGDEFVIILSHTGLEDAIFVAERMRQQIENQIFLAEDKMNIRLTASIGVATVPLHAVTKQQILKAADEALYGVKKAVRNRVIAATSPVKD
jgi:diguanylate cyclase (GGDEF)-like protein